MNKSLQFIKDKLVSQSIGIIQSYQHKLFTPMQLAVLFLKSRKLFPKNAKALELFGMHGLWHTKDYIKEVESLDIFELNPIYHQQSKSVLKKYNVQYFNENSIEWLGKTNNKYDLVVSDSPAMDEFYTNEGLPYFFEDLVKVTSPNGVIIMNNMVPKLPSGKDLAELVKKKCGHRTVKNMLEIPRSSRIQYLVLVLE